METNKILGAIILALLLAAAFSKIADMVVHPEFPEELAYKIEIPEGGSASAQAEEVDIFEVLPENYSNVGICRYGQRRETFQKMCLMSYF